MNSRDLPPCVMYCVDVPSGIELALSSAVCVVSAAVCDGGSCERVPNAVYSILVELRAVMQLHSNRNLAAVRARARAQRASGEAHSPYTVNAQPQ